MEKLAVLIFGVIVDQPWKSVAVHRWIGTQSLKTFIFCFDCVYNKWKYVMYSY